MATVARCRAAGKPGSTPVPHFAANLSMMFQEIGFLDRMAGAGLTAVIEPINTRDIPGYSLNYAAQALRIIERVGRPNLKLQFDLYHVQIMEGDLATKVRTLAGHYPHVQIAGNPGRHEPDIGEINYPFLFDLFDEIGYAGWIGCEYRPKGETRAGLGWAKRYGIQG